MLDNLSTYVYIHLLKYTVQFFSNLHPPWNDTKKAPKKKLRGSYVNIHAEVSSIIPSLDLTLPLPLCTLAIMHQLYMHKARRLIKSYYILL